MSIIHIQSMRVSFRLNDKTAPGFLEISTFLKWCYEYYFVRIILRLKREKTRPEIANLTSIQVLLTHTIHNFEIFPGFSSGRFYKKLTSHIVGKTN